MLGIFFDVIHGCLCNQSLVDVRSTDAGIKSLYCIDISLIDQSAQSR